MRRPRSDDDAAWNEIVQFLFRPLMLLCFAAIAVRIDWSKGIEFLDTELRDIALGPSLTGARPSELLRVDA